MMWQWGAHMPRGTTQVVTRGSSNDWIRGTVKVAAGPITRRHVALQWRLQQQFDCCDICGGPHYSSDCQTRNQLVYEPTPGKNYDFPCFDQPPQHHIDQSPPQDLDFESHFNLLQRDTNHILEELLRTLKPNSPVGEPEESDDYTKVPFDDEKILRQHYTTHVTPPPLAYTPPPPFLTTMEPADTLLIGDEVISTTLARENDELIKSSVDDLVPILRESEVTSDSNLERDMPVNTPFTTTDVKEENFDINSPLGEQVVDFLMENVDVADLPRHLVKQLFSHLVKNPSLTKRMSDEPLGDDSKPRSYDSDGKTRMMETPSFSFHHMLSPRPAAYSPKEVMYRYYHPHLTSDDGFNPEIESK
ncbi:hypothetical protein Tco_0256651 [Tanacetum coccineum]